MTNGRDDNKGGKQSDFKRGATPPPPPPAPRPPAEPPSKKG
jgi:hypothetical protein